MGGLIEFILRNSRRSRAKVQSQLTGNCTNHFLSSHNTATRSTSLGDTVLVQGLVQGWFHSGFPMHCIEENEFNVCAR